MYNLRGTKFSSWRLTWTNGLWHLLVPPTSPRFDENPIHSSRVEHMETYGQTIEGFELYCRGKWTLCRCQSRGLLLDWNGNFIDISSKR